MTEENQTVVLTLEKVSSNFLKNSNINSVLDVVKDAHAALSYKQEHEAQQSINKEDFLQMQSHFYDQNVTMESLVEFIANLVHIKTQNQ